VLGDTHHEVAAVVIPRRAIDVIGLAFFGEVVVLDGEIPSVAGVGILILPWESPIMPSEIFSG
jgi:hypothetical protein